MLNESYMVEKTVCGSLLDCLIKLEKCEDSSFLVLFQYIHMCDQEIWYIKDNKTMGLISANYGVEEIYTQLEMMPMSEILEMDSFNFNEQVVMTILHQYN